ncbi:MAG TPA: hypothetical protein VFR37_21330 [Longimicrobium sp.]|nr:hypothetical protein [Longimicrobium sp.]
MRRAPVLLPALALLAACDGDGGSGSDRLTPEEVAGVYNLCTLSFHPSNAALPRADLLTSVVDTTPPAGRPEATVALAANGTYDLVYTAQATAFLEQVRGSIDYREDEIVLNIPSSDDNAAALLLPGRTLLLAWDAGAHRLTGDAAGFPFAVERGYYAAAAGISEDGLQSTINGQLAISLAQGGCP